MTFPLYGGASGLVDRPHLYLDTCSLLDIMRDVTRKDANASDRKVAINLIDAVRTGDLNAWVAEQVVVEFQEHVADIEADTEQKLRNLRGQLATVNDIVELFGSSGVVRLDHFDGHAGRSRRVAEDWLAAAQAIVQDDAVAARGFARVRHNTAPATKGKQSAKDCVVVETYLGHAQALRAAGDQARIVFLSSNREDYCIGGGSLALRPPLDAEFAAGGMEYCPNFGAARHSLGL